jgi:hypothetical protein
MATEVRKKANPKFPLRLTPSVRRTAELFTEKEGVSLNQFINVTVAEKLAHLEHEEWARNRKQPTKELVARALSPLDRAGSNAVEQERAAGRQSICLWCKRSGLGRKR